VDVLDVSATVAARAVTKGRRKNGAAVAEGVERDVVGLQEIQDLRVSRLKVLAQCHFVEWSFSHPPIFRLRNFPSLVTAGQNKLIVQRHDTQHNNIQHINTHQKDTQHNNK
jgi:hypothetical protein